MRILAVDLGKVRTGLAVCDEGERLASPAGVVQEYHRDRLAAVVAAKAEEYGVGEIVVGLPRNMDGSGGCGCGHNHFGGLFDGPPEPIAPVVQSRIERPEERK